MHARQAACGGHLVEIIPEGCTILTLNFREASQCSVNLPFPLVAATLPSRFLQAWRLGRQISEHGAPPVFPPVLRERHLRTHPFHLGPVCSTSKAFPVCQELGTN